MGSWFRGRMWLAGIDDKTPLGIALDVLTVIASEAPREGLEKAHREVERLVMLADIRRGRLDRTAWGTAPTQQAQMKRLMK